MLIALWIVNGCLIGLVAFLAWRLRAHAETRRSSEEQYRTVFELVTNGLVISSPDGRVAAANPAACRMHGYSREEFLGRLAADYVHPDVLPLYEEFIKTLSAGRTFHCFGRGLRKDGEPFDVEVDGVPFSFRGKPNFLAIVRDITEQKQMTDALRHKEELNRRIVEAVPAGIVQVAKDGAILNANTNARKFLGLPLDELTKKHVIDFRSTSIYEDGTLCDPRDFPVSRCLETGEKQGPLTLGVRRPDGTLVWAMFVAVPVTDSVTRKASGAIVTFLDITPRKQAEQDLLESEERFRLLAENVPGVIYLCQNDERYSMIYVSESVEKLTGYSREEFLSGRISFVDLYHPDDKHTVPAEVNAAVEGRRPFRVRYRLRHRGGEFRWVEEAGIGVWRNNELVYLEGFLDDVTDRVHAEQALRTAQQALIDQQQKENERVRSELERVQDDLVQSTRLATIGKMAAQIAHEIRNPLGAIKNAAFFARRKIPDSETRAQENLELALREVDVCVNIIDNILNVTKIQTPKKLPLDLEPFVREAFERLWSNCPVHWKPGELRCRYEAGPEPITLRADYVQFRQVLDNLLCNAAEAMDGAGDIRVSARQTAEDIGIEISDTGPGVPAELGESIFDLFQTTKPKGTGLGLGISRQIIERHGGTLTLKPPAEASPNSSAGACFVITLPRADAG